VNLPISSFAPRPETFLEFQQISQPADRAFGTLYRYRLAQGAAQSRTPTNYHEKKISYGPATNGLCAALELISTNEIFVPGEPADAHNTHGFLVSTNGICVLGEPIEVRFYIRNVSNTN